MIAKPLFVRMNDLARQGDKPSLLPWSKSTIWRLVAGGKFPAPIKLNENTTAWKYSDIEDFLTKMESAK